MIIPQGLMNVFRHSNISGPEDIKLFSCLTQLSTKLKMLKYQESKHFSSSDKPKMLFFLLINVRMPTTVGILTFMSGKEHEKGFITSGSG